MRRCEQATESNKTVRKWTRVRAYVAINKNWKTERTKEKQIAPINPDNVILVEFYMGSVLIEMHKNGIDSTKVVWASTLCLKINVATCVRVFMGRNGIFMCFRGMGNLVCFLWNCSSLIWVSTYFRSKQKRIQSIFRHIYHSPLALLFISLSSFAIPPNPVQIADDICLINLAVLVVT